MSTNERSAVVTALFKDREAAESAWRAAHAQGYSSEEITVLLSQETHDRLFGGSSSPLSAKAAQAAEEPHEGAEKVGGPAGGSMGTVAPALAAIGTLMLIPGGILAAGPIAIALTAAGAVGVAGGVIGALTNWGLPKPRVEKYEQAIRDGGVLLGVEAHSPSDAQQLADAWKRSGGEMVHA